MMRRLVRLCVEHSHTLTRYPTSRTLLPNNTICTSNLLLHARQVRTQRLSMYIQLSPNHPINCNPSLCVAIYIWSKSFHFAVPVGWTGSNARSWSSLALRPHVHTQPHNIHTRALHENQYKQQNTHEHANRYAKTDSVEHVFYL